VPDVVMPRLSDSMEEGTILRWLKADGDEIKRGDELAEIETDKATMTYEADTDGVLKIVAQEGDTLPIGQVIATIGGGDGGDGAAKPAEGARAEATETAAAGEAPAQQVAAGTGQQAPPAAPPSAAAGAPAPSNGASAEGNGRVKASPVARRIARERGVDLAALQGTGPGGRIVKADVEGAQPGQAEQPAPAAEAATAEAPATAAAPASVPPPAPVVAETGTAKGDVTHEELTRTQQVVARRMAESKATVPEFTIQTEVDMENAVGFRTELKGLADPAPSYNDMVVKACAIALREFPRANAAYRDARFELYSRINVGIAVAAENALIVPTIFDADKKGLGEIARDSRALAERVRAGVVTPPELSGGTFTVSNLGMFGVTEFTAVINPPQAAILAVGSMAPRAVVHDGELVARHTMALTLVSDHRILYGADAAQFLARIRALLEAPLALSL
jgi:pyruvate dehydrogenase E2 component (dihydrolipoamide acetyltransferase)